MLNLFMESEYKGQKYRAAAYKMFVLLLKILFFAANPIFGNEPFGVRYDRRSYALGPNIISLRRSRNSKNLNKFQSSISFL